VTGFLLEHLWKRLSLSASVAKLAGKGLALQMDIVTTAWGEAVSGQLRKESLRDKETDWRCHLMHTWMQPCLKPVL
jgi:hypothetical protein